MISLLLAAYAAYLLRKQLFIFLLGFVTCFCFLFIPMMVLFIGDLINLTLPPVKATEMLWILCVFSYPTGYLLKRATKLEGSLI